MEAAQLARTEIHFDQNKRDYDDLTTMFAEMVNGNMRTPFEYTFDDRELHARDGSTMRQVFEDSLDAADELARTNPEMAFEVRRRRHEIDEHYDMLKMAQGKLPNTMIVVSDFPAELMDQPNDIGGYNVARKITMLRVLAWDGNRLKMYSQTLDGSDRQALEAIYASLGSCPRQGELLSQRVHMELDTIEQDFLINKLTGVYDYALQRQFGGTWQAGRLSASSLNTYDFVREQRDLVQYALQQKRLGQLNIYDIVAALQARFEKNIIVAPEQAIPRFLDPFYNLRAEIYQSSTEARVMGRIFSACGITLGTNELSAAEELSAAGYGNKTSDKYGSLDFDCPHCHRKNTRPRNKLIPNCKHCYKDVSCK